MKNIEKTNEQLLIEIEQLKTKVAKLKDSESDYKRAEEKLKKSEERYKGITQNTASCIAVYEAIENGKNFVFVDFNPMAEKVEQISKDEVIGKKVTEVFPGVVKFGLFKVFQNVWKTGKPEHFPVSIYKDNRIQGYRENYVYKLSSGEIVTVYQDLTKKKQAEEELRKSQTFNESLLNVSPDIIYIYDIVERKNIYSNKGIMKVLGYSTEEVKSMGENLIPELMYPDDFTIYLKETIPKYQTAKDGDLIEHEYRMKHKSGSWCWLHSKESIYERLEDGTPKQIFGIIGNITEQKMVNEALKSSRDYLENLTNSIADAIYSVKMPERVIEWVNDSFNIFGYEPDECIGEDTGFLHINPDSYKSFGKKMNQIIAAGKDVLNTEYLLKRKNGEIFPAEVTITFHKENNEVVNITAVIRDITERKKSEEQIERFSRIFEDSLNEIFLFDEATLKFIQVNNAAQQNLGYTMEELQKMTPLSFKPEFTDESFAKLVEPLRKGAKEKIVFETVHQRKDQSLYNVEVHLQLLHFEDHDTFAAFILDITERKLAEEALKKHQENLEELIKERTIELEEKNKRLDDSMKVFVGREMTIKKLQDKIKALGEE